ncbi:hypothetical protein GTR02_04285 [Kineococcus sp. R8]|uniref:hypothetical protein n=1 Tax=Kineococcus siccus TaxID=2696567 RepID=UPI001411B395|nr:hypothetical protein [Kineococcus siccus]NAZ81033.1 hypothetical protein [Kineococcus siccus]
MLTEMTLAQSLSHTATTGLAFVVVASATTWGTARAVRCLHQLELAGVDGSDLYLVMTRDGRGPIPVAARARLRLLAAVVRHIVLVPHVVRWRYDAGDPPQRSSRYDRAVEDLLRHLTSRQSTGTAAPPADPSTGVEL